MNAMIFAAGLGTRLRPLTDNCPKALVKVDDKSLLEHNIIKLKKAGFENIVVNVHHFGQQIIDFLDANNNFGINIKVSDERDLLLDTGGGIKKALSLFENNEPVLIHNVDIISDIDLHDVYQRHIISGADATLCVAKRNTSRYLLFDNDNIMQGWTNITTGELKGEKADNLYAFSGIHVINRSLESDFKLFDKEVFSIIEFYLTCCTSRKLKANILSEAVKWVDCGKPESLANAAEITKYYVM